jgi:hypothetical protein
MFSLISINGSPVSENDSLIDAVYLVDDILILISGVM